MMVTEETEVEREQKWKTSKVINQIQHSSSESTSSGFKMTNSYKCKKVFSIILFNQYPCGMSKNMI